MQLRSVVDGLVNHTGGAFSWNGLRPWSTTWHEQMSAGRIQTFVPVLVGRAASPRSAPSRSRPVRS